MFKPLRAGLVAAALSAQLAACSSVPYAQREAQRLAAYQAAAGAPVQDFHVYHALWSWESLGHDQAVVYTQADRAWLLDVPGCIDLPYAHAIALTSSLSRVRVGLDQVLTGRANFPCFIRRIRPVNVRQLRLERGKQRRIDTVARPRAGLTVAH